MTIDFTEVVSVKKLQSIIKSDDPDIDRTMETFLYYVEADITATEKLIHIFKNHVEIKNRGELLLAIQEIIELTISTGKLYKEKIELETIRILNRELIIFFGNDIANDEITDNLMDLYFKLELLHQLKTLAEQKSDLALILKPLMETSLAEVQGRASRKILEELNPSIQIYMNWLDKN